MKLAEKKSKFRHFLFNRLFVFKMFLENEKNVSDKSSKTKRFLDELILLLQYEKVLLGEKIKLFRKKEYLKEILEFAKAGVSASTKTKIEIDCDEIEIHADNNLFTNAVKFVILALCYGNAKSVNSLILEAKNGSGELRFSLGTKVPDIFMKKKVNYLEEEDSYVGCCLQIAQAIFKEHGLKLVAEEEYVVLKL